MSIVTETYSGLTPSERAVIILDESGLSFSRIATQLDLAVDYVRATVRNYSFRHCWDGSDRLERMIRAGDRRYAAALAATGKRYA